MSGFISKEKRSSYVVWGVLFAVIIIIALIRFHLAGVSLERDEGEYAYAGQLLLKGVLPYAAAYNEKLPGIFAIYALILAVFGETHVGVHLGLLLFNTASMILLFLLVRKLFNDAAGVISAVFFGFLSLSQSVQGIFANAEHFVVFFALCGILILLYAVDLRRWYFFFLSGLFLGLAFITKQHGIFFILFGISYLVFVLFQERPVPWRDIAVKVILFSAGAVFPFLLICLIFYLGGVFDKFWLWTFQYAKEYVSYPSFAEDFKGLVEAVYRIFLFSVPLWIFAGVGISALFWDRGVRARRFFLGGFFLFSFFSICPGLFFRPHYFVLLLPSIAVLGAVGVLSLGGLFQKPLIQKGIPVLLVLLSVFYVFYKERGYYFEWSPTMVSRMVYGGNPFPESLVIADYIRKNSLPGDRILVFGSEPQIFFYSRRHSATGYIYILEMMKKHDYALTMQKEMIKEVEKNKPLFIIVVKIRSSLGIRKDSPKMVFQWFDKYIQHYQQIGIVDILSNDKTVYLWDEASLEYFSRIKDWREKFTIFIFKRKND
jgi:hypothetical protein